LRSLFGQVAIMKYIYFVNKQSMRTIFALIILLSGSLSFASPAITTNIPLKGDKVILMEPVFKKITALKVKDVQKMIGRKLSLKEKIGFWLLKKKMKKQASDGSNQGKTAYILGFVGLGLLIAGLFLPYVILGSIVAAVLAIVFGSMAGKRDPTDRKGYAGKLMGWITLGLIVALVLILVAIFASIFN
jgi:hypothetical protein